MHGGAVLSARNKKFKQSVAFPRWSRQPATTGIPTYASAAAAGADLFSPVASVIRPRAHATIDLGIQVSLPLGTYGRIAPRSGTAIRNGVDVLAGVVDQDYRGNVVVVLINHSDVPFYINVGDRIAQIIVTKIARVAVVPSEVLDTTIRGGQGFGSTGQGELDSRIIMRPYAENWMPGGNLGRGN